VFYSPSLQLGVNVPVDQSKRVRFFLGFADGLRKEIASTTTLE
jgi:hypothetical protein